MGQLSETHQLKTKRDYSGKRAPFLAFDEGHIDMAGANEPFAAVSLIDLGIGS